MVSIADYVSLNTSGLTRKMKRIVRDDGGFEDVLRNRVKRLKKYQARAVGDALWRIVAYRVVNEQDCEVLDGGDLNFNVLEFGRRRWYPNTFCISPDEKNLEFRDGLWVFPERLREFAGITQKSLVLSLWDFLEAAVEEHEFDYEIRVFNSQGETVSRVKS